MKRKLAPNEVQLGLLYSGPEVKDGTISVEDMVAALLGFPVYLEHRTPRPLFAIKTPVLALP